LIDKQIERIAHHYNEVLEMQIMEEKPAKDPDLVLHYAMIHSSMVFIRVHHEGWKELKLGGIFVESSTYHENKRPIIKESIHVEHLGDRKIFRINLITLSVLKILLPYLIKVAA